MPPPAPIHEFWQSLAPRSKGAPHGPFSGHYPAALGDDTELRLPILT